MTKEQAIHLAKKSFAASKIPQAVIRNPFGKGYTVMTLASAKANGLKPVFDITYKK